jgi:hypothetical protein
MSGEEVENGLYSAVQCSQWPQSPLRPIKETTLRFSGYTIEQDDWSIL